MKSVCIVTGTRAEFGLLLPLINRIRLDNELDLRVAVTGAHLSISHGETYREIVASNIAIDVAIPILERNGSAVTVSEATGLAVSQFSRYFADTKPDIVVVLGDRYEMLGVAIAAMLNRIPIAHIHGGETTEGAIDESIRHAITKMSYLHFTSCEAYRHRVIQLGESPNRVFNVGALGVENIKALTLLEIDVLEKEIGFSLELPFFLVTFHPATLDSESPAVQMRALLNALKRCTWMRVIFTKANADVGGQLINELIDQFVNENKERSNAYINLGQLKYLSAMRYCTAVVGNTSSGIIEAPSLHVPTVNIGDRQKGRLQAASIINCMPEEEAIYQALLLAASQKSRSMNISNPYEGQETSRQIHDIIKGFLLREGFDLKKEFYDISFDMVADR